MNRDEHLIKVGITHGDYNGIGYEIIIRTFMEHGMLELCTPIVYGYQKAAAAFRKTLNANDFNFYGIHSADKAARLHCNLISISEKDFPLEPGQATKPAGELAVLALEKAMADLQAGLIDVLVTAPINKHTTHSEQFPFAGHTEYLAKSCNSKEYLMLLVSGSLRVGTVTGHVPINEVAAKLSPEAIVKKLRVLNSSLIQDFGIRKPKIAVLGLNPHAGDGGVIGKEEEAIINPAIETANNEGILAMGPFAADGYFGSGTFRKFDAVLAMYHDQGLIPFKSLAFHEGVNYTAGLPIIRTSPDHGTAYDIVGKGIADPSSFREAIYLAIDVFRKRKLHREINANPLQIQQRRERER